MKKCLITGASGFLGRELVPALGKSWEVVGIGHRHPGEAHLRMDIREEEAFRMKVKELRPDAVVHAAAYRDPDFCEDQPDETNRLNLHPTRALCAALPPGTPLVFTSTDYVFDGTSAPYGESDPVCPVNVYGASKAASEALVLNHPGGVVLRIPLLIGANPTFEGSGFITQMFQSVTDGREQAVDDVLMRFPTWTRNVAQAIGWLLEGQREGIYHMSGQEGRTRYGWTMALAALCRLPVDHLAPSADVVPRRAARPPNSQLATDKIRSEGFDTFTPFDEVVLEVLRSFGKI